LQSPVGKVQRYFLAEPALMTNAVAITDQEHPDRQLGINRGSTDIAVKRLPGQIRQSRPRKHVDPRNR
jgi:hypothetical protein